MGAQSSTSGVAQQSTSSAQGDSCQDARTSVNVFLNDYAFVFKYEIQTRKQYVPESPCRSYPHATPPYRNAEGVPLNEMSPLSKDSRHRWLFQVLPQDVGHRPGRGQGLLPRHRLAEGKSCKRHETLVMERNLMHTRSLRFLLILY